MIKEIWKLVSIPKFDNKFEVSNLGRVRSHKGNILAFINMGDIIRVSLKSSKKQRRMAVHRLVAYAFFGTDINNKTIVVKHIDGNIHNNCVDNLRVIDRGIEKIRNKKPIKESGVNNINWHPPLNKWKVAYRIRRKKEEYFKHIGYFHLLEDAKKIHELWFNSFKHIIPDTKYPGLNYLEGEKKWRVDVFDKEGNLYHIDHYDNEKEALEDWKLFYRAVNHKH